VAQFNSANTDLESLLKSASYEQSRGNMEGSEQRYRAALALSPSNVFARYELAKLALQAGKPHDAAQAMSELIGMAPHEPAFRGAYGKALATLLDFEQARAQYAQAVRLDPGNVVFHLSYGELCLQCDDRDEALRAFQRAAIMVPQLGAVSDQVPDDVRTSIQLAVSNLENLVANLADETLLAVRQAYPQADLSRLEPGVRSCGADTLPRYSNPRRRPPTLYLPGIAEIPWFDSADLPWAAEVQALYPEIRAELEGLLDAQSRFEPYVDATSGPSPTGSDFSNLRGSMDWNSLHLSGKGNPGPEILERCPVTASLASRVPCPSMPGSPEIFFSRLRPGAHIRPHFGQMNVRLTAHMGLIIPQGCGIRVLDEERQWKPGVVMAFDDSFEHEAWNRSQQERIVLIFEAWHPDVTLAEQFGIETLLKLRQRWLGSFKNDPLLPPLGQQPRIEWI
jgi:aspartate beta-hydroxylase